MTQLRFLGTETAYVSPLGRSVDPDESVEVDDALIWRAATDDDEGNPTGYVWPEELWAEVGSGRRRQTPVQKAPKPAADSTTDDDTSKEG